jgi:molecular chaperone Hsp33
MMGVLAPVMVQDAASLFGDEPAIRMSCPRCGARYTITREAMEAHVKQT